MRKLIVICLLCMAADSPAATADVLDKLPFIGVNASLHERRGFLDLGGGYVEELEKNDLLTGGVVLGKRWRLSHRLRLQALVNLNYGTVVDDTLPLQLSDNTSAAALLTTSLFYGGAVAALQYPFYASPDASWYVQGGAGVHVVEMRETEALQDDSNVRVNDDYLEEHATYSLSAHGGLGFEIAMSPLFGVSLAYSLRYWYPVRYAMRRDFFPLEAKDYRERFLSHELELLILVKRY